MIQDAFDAFTRDFHELASRDPNEAVYLGLDVRRGELPDPSLSEGVATVEASRTLLDRAAGLDRAALSFDDQLDLDLAKMTLKSGIHAETMTWNGLTTRQQKPDAGRSISYGMFLLFARDLRPAGERLADITDRIERIPDFVAAMLSRLDTPVARWVDIDLEKVRGLPEFFETLHAWAVGERWPDATRLDRLRYRANEALADYAAKLEALPTTTALHLDEADARRLVALRGIEPSFEELHRFATRFLAETGEIIEVLRARLADKYDLPADIGTEPLQRELCKRYQVAPPGTDLDRILDRYRAERDKILGFIRDRDLFPIPDDQEFVILRTPAFMAPSIPAGAMEPPAPFAPGPRRSLVYLTLSEELRDEHTELGIPGMMIHEGIPGHHLQLATAAAHPSLIRRHAVANEHAEGWTTMLEDYMLDQGYMGELTDEARFIGKRDIARIGARVAIDLFFMTGERDYLDVGVPCDITDDDPFVAAGNLLAEVTGFTPGRVQAELNWYSQERGYPLSYLTGNRLVWQLKRDMADAQRGKLEGLDLDREFHRVYLQSGNMPVSFLRRVFRHQGLL